MKPPEDVPTDSELLRELPEDSVLASYFAGEDDAVAKASIREWVGGDTRRQQTLERLRDGWDGAARNSVHGDLQGFLQALWTRIGGEETTVVRERREEQQDSGQVRHGKVASSGTQALRRGVWWVCSVFGVVLAFLALQPKSPLASGRSRMYATGRNEQATLTLDDGTQVTLAPQTTLRLVDFSVQHRLVAVDGRAYFSVTHSGGAPFEVRGGTITARVLGTAFLIEHAPNTSHVRVAVEEGKVRVSNASHRDAAITVAAGYVGDIIDSVTNVTAVGESTPGMQWQHEHLVFYNMPVSAVLQTLTRWYGYQFRCVDSALPKQNTTISVSTRSAMTALATLEQVLRVNVEVVGDTVTLVPQGKQRAKGMSRVRGYDIWTHTNREVGR